MKSAVWSLLLLTAVLACASTACAQQTAGSKKAASDDGKANTKRLFYRDEEEREYVKAPESDRTEIAANELLNGTSVNGTYFNGLSPSTNLFSTSTANISNSATPEFTATFVRGTETADFSTMGVFTLNVLYPSFPTYYAGEYTFTSEAFKGFDDIQLIQNTLPDGCHPEVSSASELNNEGRFRISIPDFTVHPAKIDKVNFTLKYQLVPEIECEHGYDTPCCSKHGKLLKAGVVCWRSDVCQGAVCNGHESTCPEQSYNLPNGTECLYDPVAEDFSNKFSPFITPRSPREARNQGDKVKASSYKPRYPKEGSHYPPCLGQCQAGACHMDKSVGGCCTLSRRKRHAYAAKTAAAGTGGGRSKAEAEEQVLRAMKGGVLCWDGDNENYHSKSQ